MNSETPVYVPGYGEMTAGQVAEAIRAEEKPAESPWEADLRRLEAVCTENLSPNLAWPGATPSDGRA